MTDPTERDLLLEQAGEAVSAMSCPAYRFAGTCVSGCSQEPSCQVDEPTEGWERQLLDAAILLTADKIREDQA
jgi:hypothetical protein